MEQQIAAGIFKAKCLQILDEVKQRRSGVVITKRGRPVARLVPIEEQKVEVFGRMRGRMKIIGDIVGPVGESWDAEK